MASAPPPTAGQRQRKPGSPTAKAAKPRSQAATKRPESTPIARDRTWQTFNQRYLTSVLQPLGAALAQQAHRQAQVPLPRQSQPQSTALYRWQLEIDLTHYLLGALVLDVPALTAICHRFELSAFERDLLLLCAGVELEATWAPLCAAAQGDPQRTYPTFSLVLAILPNPHWRAISPDGPLRRWQLLTVDTSPNRQLTHSPLKIDERLLHSLLGMTVMDERLLNLVEPIETADPLVPSQQAVAQQLIAAWKNAPDGRARPVLQLCGDDRSGKQAIARAVCQHFQLPLYRLNVNMLPTAPQELYQLLRLWEREYRLAPCVLLLDCNSGDRNDGAREAAISYWLEHLDAALLLTVRDRRPPQQRPLLGFDVGMPNSKEQHQLWCDSLGEQAVTTLNGHIDTLVSQFNLTAPVIRATSATALNQHAQQSQQNGKTGRSLPLERALWQACRTQARPHLDDLAQRITSQSQWDDLILPEGQKIVLRELAAHVRQRAKVYEKWGFGGDSGRGLGISALFAGASGTGKTMAADVLANELKLDLYRIDLSSVVSKYIGETEKNLRRVFDAAETGGAILLFDEADALFGKRSEVKDSHDRHANIEVSYLLQRMESYRGLAILTTNLRDALDQAFLRRIRFSVRFPFPDAEQRAAIWQRVFPKKTPTEGLDMKKLARLGVAGGNIRNIALNAAFLAADAGEPVQMKHILLSAKSEYLKLEKPMTDAEIKGWV
ncbi:MAG: AAA family ATPase [Spirulinaceae cyanobacterium SM2_1_0]|nr:AAA family ATPase [Spirulinaceae cyanobacterium SM2_1_0]